MAHLNNCIFFLCNKKILYDIQKSATCLKARMKAVMLCKVTINYESVNFEFQRNLCTLKNFVGCKFSSDNLNIIKFFFRSHYYVERILASKNILPQNFQKHNSKLH